MKKFVLFATVTTLLIAAPVLAQDPAVSASSPAATAEATTQDKIRVEIKIGTDVQNREIVGESDNFTIDTPKLAAWTRIIGSSQPTQVWHVWKVNGEEISKVALNVTSSYFRTFSRKDVNRQAGNWTLEVRDAGGNVIGSKDFTVGAAPEGTPAQ
jgi:hypothetical protein